MTNVKTKNYEISDEALKSVNGGFILIGKEYNKPEDVVFKFAIGSKVEYVWCYIWRAFTKQCTIIDRKVDKYPDGKGYCAWYKVSCTKSAYNNKWYPEKAFEGGFDSVDTYSEP